MDRCNANHRDRRDIDRGDQPSNSYEADINIVDSNAKLAIALDQALHEKEILEQELQAIYRSRSWKVTMPLRRSLQASRWIRWQTIAWLRIGLNEGRALGRRLPAPIKRLLYPLVSITRSLPQRAFQKQNIAHLQSMSERRLEEVSHWIEEGSLTTKACHPSSAEEASTWPIITISLVTYNSEKWLEGLFNSLFSQDYPTSRIEVIIVDNGSQDGTIDLINKLISSQGYLFSDFQLHQRPNLGFGAAHNWAAKYANGDFILITNPDLEFDKPSISRCVRLAVNDSQDIASWELRQRPFEHPKHYDPVSWETHWSSHACILIRRTVFEKLGGHDERIFLYGEDVEFSFRCREAGYRLRYCPTATVAHYTYEQAHQIKPAQYLGSTRANLYLRLRYGNWLAQLSGIFLAGASLTRKQPFDGTRKALLSEFFQLAKQYPEIIKERKNKRYKNIGVFRNLDYELTRHGAFIEVPPPALDEKNSPLVSIITRTYQGRDWLLQQAGLSVFQQTYPSIEWIVIEDGGNSCKDIVDKLDIKAPCSVVYASQEKLGRSAAGNLGLSLAQGHWCLFLDDDDLLYSDHVEALVNQLTATPWACAAYSLAWDVKCDISSDNKSILETAYIQHTDLIQPHDASVLAERNYFPIQAVLFERRLYLERGGFHAGFDQLEDWNLWRRYAENETFQLVKKTTSLYRTPADTARSSNRQALLDQAYQQVKSKTDFELGKKEFKDVD
uniref:glycosyltransferase family 2 protein n=1 Tax=uncultured Halomonas sp. TaxID=173971 RepID=UPI002610E4F0|nr:glycosyltransferase family 2 protein [uncultured Halomonas sp.]